MTACVLRIHGRVQGVSYRASLAAQAGRLGLKGWLRNRRDGTVEALLAGADDALDALETWAWQGPPLARVTRVERQATAAQPGGDLAEAFETRPTV